MVLYTVAIPILLSILAARLCTDSTSGWSKESDRTYVIVIKTHGYEWLEGTAFWESPTLQDPITKENKEALDDFKDGKDKQRKGV